MDDRTTRDGMLLGIGAFLIWGLLPLYLKLLADVPAAQVLSHRIVWSLLLLAAIVVVLRRTAVIRAAAQGRTLLLLCATAALIGVNWMAYIWAIQNGQVLAASLGYFINPLVNVALGTAVLGERISPTQRAAVALAALGVGALALSGSLLTIGIALILAIAFGTYGLIRKVIAIDALGGLTMETLILAPLALGWLIWSDRTGAGAFGQSMRMDWLLILAGAVTAAPLLMFAAAARRLRYSTLGLLQFIAPTLQFLEAVLLFGEPLRAAQLLTFALIWAGCALYAWDSLRVARTAAAR